MKKFAYGGLVLNVVVEMSQAGMICRGIIAAFLD